MSNLTPAIASLVRWQARMSIGVDAWDAYEAAKAAIADVCEDPIEYQRAIRAYCEAVNL